MRPMKLSWELSLFSAPSGPISSFIFIFLKEGTINCKTWKFTKLAIHQKNNERVQGDSEHNYIKIEEDLERQVHSL